MRDYSNHFVTSVKANSQQTVEKLYRIATNLRLNRIISEEVLTHRTIETRLGITRKQSKERYGSYFINQMADRPLVDNLSKYEKNLKNYLFSIQYTIS